MIHPFLLTVLIIYGIHASTRDGMLLAGIPLILIRLLTKVIKNENTVVNILKPLFDCTPCMASVYGTLMHLLMFPGAPLIGVVIWVLSISGFNFILNKLINR